MNFNRIAVRSIISIASQPFNRCSKFVSLHKACYPARLLCIGINNQDGTRDGLTEEALSTLQSCEINNYSRDAADVEVSDVEIQPHWLAMERRVKNRKLNRKDEGPSGRSPRRNSAWSAENV